MNNQEIIDRISSNKVQFQATVFEKILQECEDQNVSHENKILLMAQFAIDLHKLIEKTINLKQ